MIVELKNLYCTRCGAEFDMNIKKSTSYSGPLHLPNLFCPFCGSKRLVKREILRF